jgi:hypothetical protein
MYHGTTAASAAFICSEGLAAGSCVTPDLDLAWYYAEAAAEEVQGAGDEDAYETVVRLTVNVEELQADSEAFAEPVGWGGSTGSAIEERIEQDDATATLENTLSYCASARVRKRIAAERLGIAE